MGLDRKRHSDQSVVEEIEARSLGVEADLLERSQMIDQRAEFVGRTHDMVFVRSCRGRSVDTISLKQRLLRYIIRFIFGLGLSRRRSRHRSRLGTRCLHRREHIALTRQRRRTLCARLFERRLNQLRLLGLRGRGSLGGGRRIGRQLTSKHIEIQLDIELTKSIVIGIFDAQSLGIKLDRHVQHDRRQTLREQQLLGTRLDICALFRGQLVGMFEDLLDRTELIYKLYRALFANSLHTGNVVRRIAPQRQHIAHQERLVESVMLANRLTVNDFNALALLFVDLDAVGHQLSVVLVGRDHKDLETLRSSLVRERSDHVISLITSHFEHGNTHRLAQLLDVGHGGVNILGRCRAIGLVGGKNLAAETSTLGVESHAEAVGLLASQDVAQELDKPEHGRGIQTLAVAHRARHKCVVVSENQRISVNQKESFHLSKVLRLAYSFVPSISAKYSSTDLRKCSIVSSIVRNDLPPAALA